MLQLTAINAVAWTYLMITHCLTFWVLMIHLSHMLVRMKMTWGNWWTLEIFLDVWS